jgi:hypothetical protein
MGNVLFIRGNFVVAVVPTTSHSRRDPIAWGHDPLPEALQVLVKIDDVLGFGDMPNQP